MKRLLLIAWLTLLVSAHALPAQTPSANQPVLPATNSAPEPKQEVRKMKIHSSGSWKPNLTETELNTLFAIAKDTLDWCVNRKPGRFSFEQYSITSEHKKYSATFVTLKIHHELRGCIGSLEAVEPLYLSVHHNAISAAMHDPRFSPVEPDELPNISMDVSVLSTNRPISSLAEFKVGEHGIILEKGGRRAVFLPEVATEQGWSKEETLTFLSRKAGLELDAWKSGATFQVFESCVISQE